ncbi:aryl-sulfate sulfotransferase [bacterium]|nr:aryl-sulfate sulfotransferase [bacterium]
MATVLPSLTRLTAETGGAFVSQLTGAEYADDLAWQGLSRMQDVAVFSAGWSDESPALANAAFCLYRLKLDRAKETATLAFAWDGAAPRAGTCWIGLPDWTDLSWTWQLLPEANAIEIDDPALYADENNRCYVAVILLDSAYAFLMSIGFGEEPPPEEYNLFYPMYDTTTYLTDIAGNIVHTWESEYRPASIAYLRDNGNLVRPGELSNNEIMVGGGGGIIEEITWDGEVVWQFYLSSSQRLMHHDIELLPNGNILAIVTEVKDKATVLAAGRSPQNFHFNDLLVDSILEIEPLPEVGGNIVWEWHIWDHIVQNTDPELPHYGEPSDYPELGNVNYYGDGHDWTHVNAVDYNAELDQIMICNHGFKEIWVVDHSTTTAEAAGHTGGRYGHGGDILYRWGNPLAYGIGTTTDRVLNGQHDARWVDPGLPGAGNIMVFNNNAGSFGNLYSKVIEFTPPVDGEGFYAREDGVAFGPAELAWSFVYDPPTDMYASYISGAHRIRNGNTVICVGDIGWFLEVTADGEVVWDYTNPYTDTASYSVFRMERLFGDHPGLAALLATDG